MDQNQGMIGENEWPNGHGMDKMSPSIKRANDTELTGNPNARNKPKTTEATNNRLEHISGSRIRLPENVQAHVMKRYGYILIWLTLLIAVGCRRKPDYAHNFVLPKSLNGTNELSWVCHTCSVTNTLTLTLHLNDKRIFSGPIYFVPAEPSLIYWRSRSFHPGTYRLKASVKETGESEETTFAIPDIKEISIELNPLKLNTHHYEVGYL